MSKPFINKKGLIDEGDGWCNSLEQHDYELRESVIEEFAEKIRAYSGEHYIDCDGNPYGCKPDLVFMTDAFLDDIVKQLKEQNK